LRGGKRVGVRFPLPLLIKPAVFVDLADLDAELGLLIDCVQAIRHGDKMRTRLKCGSAIMNITR